MRVLVVDHTRNVSGAEHSMLTLLAGLDGGEATIRLACPLGGALERAAWAAGLEPLGIPASDGGLRLHPIGTPRTLACLTAAAARTAVLARRTRADLLHANSLRAGLIATAAARLVRRPAVVHVRDVLPRGAVADATLRIVAAGADELIAISQHVAASVREVMPSARPRTIHNPVDLRRFDPDRIDPARTRRELGVSEETILLAVVGQITPWKGQLDAVRALAALACSHPGLRLAVVGEVKFAESTTRYDNPAYLRDIEAVVDAEGLRDRVLLLGERADVPDIMGASDMVLVPSWSEPFGRVVVEGMAMGAVVLATAEGGPAEILASGRDGLLLAPRDPAGWAREIAALCDDPARREALGAAARARAADFARGPHAAAVLEVYRATLARRAGSLRA